MCRVWAALALCLLLCACEEDETICVKHSPPYVIYTPIYIDGTVYMNPIVYQDCLEYGPNPNFKKK